jgi:hypothetical protein
MLAHLLFPSACASAELVARVDAFLAAGELDPGLVRVLTEQRELMQRALRARDLPG